MSNDSQKPAADQPSDADAPAKDAADRRATSAPTQAVRRTAFGANVLIAIVAVAGLVVLANWAGNAKTRRFDLTATRQYSLSPQTSKLLNALNADYEMITLLGSRGAMASTAEEERITKARDLVNEYSRQSSHIKVQHVDPDVQVDELKAVYKSLHDRFLADVKPARDAIAEGMATLKDMQAAAVDQAAAMGTILEDPSIADPRVKRQFEQAQSTFKLLATEGATVLKQLERSLDTPMPDYAGQLLELQAVLSRWSTRGLQPMGAAFDVLSNDRHQSDHVVDAALRMVDLTDRSSKRINETLIALGRVRVPDAYNRLLTDSVTADSAVLVLGPEGTRKAQFVGLSQMFLGATRAADTGGSQEQVFRGEELLTSAMIRMRMEIPPLVVFAYTGSTPAIGPGGPYSELGKRLEGAGFEVMQWNPMGVRAPGAPPLPPSPAPTPRAGQEVVWIFPPLEQPNPQNPLPTGADRVGQLMRDRMDIGDGVLVMVGYDPAARFNSTDPFVQTLTAWGITAETGKLILREQQISENEYQTNGQFLVGNWPTDLPITRALSGLPGFTMAASPLKVSPDKPESVQVWPLIELKEDRQWAESDFAGDSMPKYNAALSADTFNVALAAEHEQRRLVVISTPIFGMNDLLTVGRGGAGTAEITGAAFPANAEFFVNSAYWLANLDTLIAASARTQDIRRIDPMSDTTQTTIRWSLLAGVPALTLLVGLCVWQVRRRA